MWQDWVFAAGGVFFSWSVASMVRDRRTVVSRSVSVSTASILLAFAVAQLTLGLCWTAGVTLGTAVCWALVALRRVPGV